jgi:hypothetical protein
MSDLWSDLSRIADDLTSRDEVRALLLRRLGQFLEDVHRIAIAIERIEQKGRMR